MRRGYSQQGVGASKDNQKAWEHGPSQNQPTLPPKPHFVLATTRPSALRWWGAYRALSLTLITALGRDEESGVVRSSRRARL